MPQRLLPRALHAGSRVALISPAGPSKPERLEAALARCAELGLVAAPGKSVLASTGYLAGPDTDRRVDFETAIADPTIDAIWALRGGYGTMRLLDRLDLSPLCDQPKAFIGFSDNTAVHLALTKLGMISFHGAHAGADYGQFTVGCLKDVLFRSSPAGPLPVPDGSCITSLVPGAVEGPLVGGNLSLLAAACGTPFAMEARGRIVFIEDVNEPGYRIDRAFTQLRLAGCLDGVLGFAFGAFSWNEDSPENEPSPEHLLRELVEPFGVPAMAGLPFGHIDEQWCLPLGVRARLDCDAGELSLLEPAVTDG